MFRSLPSYCLPLVLVSLLLSGCYEQTVGFPPDDDDDGSADVDQDGFPAEVDCNDENASVYPGAVEICNALDDDCDQTIDEETECYDDDLDGQTEQQGDCDDTNPNIYTGATELCDGIDNDCDADGAVDEDGACGESADEDNDGYTAAIDCDDADPYVHPGVTEICDGEDEDCDGVIDDGTECFDDDGDGYSEEEDDCDDNNAATNPAASEICDAQDNDCNGLTDDGITCADDDADGDGYATSTGDCNDADPAVYLGAPETCNGVDNDCDGVADNGTDCFDDDGDGETEDEGDCDDNDSTTHSGAVEVCDSVSNDCDTKVDEGLDCSDDVDGDGYDSADGDCDDTNPAIYPGATEVCDGFDNDCDSTVDEDSECTDDDGDGYSENAGDCNDNDSTINPGAEEIVDSVDNDCDSIIDEVDLTCDLNETEPNDEQDEADSMSLGDLVCGTVNTATGASDTDFFDFTVGPWTELTIDIDTTGATSFDSQLILYDEDGDYVWGNDDDPSGSGPDAAINVILIEEGDYAVQIQDANGADDPTYSYVMTFQGESVCDTPEPTTDNDSFGNAGWLTPGDNACGIITDCLFCFADQDYFALTVEAGDQVVFDILGIEGSNSDLDAQLTLFDTNGTSELMVNEPSGNIDPYFQYTFNVAGTYYIMIEADGHVFNDTGPYLLYTTLL
ncbi:MAG: hypothetical protein CL928_01945 [Deltaproteobacteria bacterium]|nr:hypothetical protein [Deltaproteobacteria bacterium]